MRKLIWVILVLASVWWLMQHDIYQKQIEMESICHEDRWYATE